MWDREWGKGAPPRAPGGGGELRRILRTGARGRGLGRSSIGDNSILGDGRWGGLYGIEADFVAHENCKICSIRCDYIQARPWPKPRLWATGNA